MSLISLRNIGKIYVSEGNVSVGIRGVNLDLDKGEFVAVTGKSGSGKSTLLNVLSGMDTYEEGEMFVEGNPTSHYMQADWEEYRKKYISFIFQDYNIIESFTVLQNVELALMNIENPKERRRRALELIRRVGLEGHIRHKGSKLSGGQKQRTVIARALAKDSPIILADEPTGNLDSETSKEIVALLHEISKEKLVVVVTHNFDELEAFATRHIRIFDGAVESDHTISSDNIIHSEFGSEVDEELKYKRNAHMRPKSDRKHTLKNGIHLGKVRFSARPKLSVFLSVLMTLTALVITLMSSISSDALGLFEKNYIVEHINGRLLIARRDGAAMTDEELESLKNKTGASSYVHYDFMLDQTVRIRLGDTNYRYSFGYPASSVKPDVGRQPEKTNEVLMLLPLSYKEQFPNPFKETEILMFNKAVYTVTGIKYYYDNTLIPKLLFTDEGYEIASAIAYLSKNSQNFSFMLELSADSISRTFNVSGDHIFVDFTLGNGEFCYDNQDYRSFRKSAEKNYPNKVSLKPTIEAYYVNYTYNTYYQGGGFSVDVMIEPEKPFYGEDKMLTLLLSSSGESDSPSAALKELLKKRENTANDVYISPDVICDFLYDVYYKESYTQASLFFGSDAEAHSAASMLKKEGYIPVPSDSVREDDIEDVIEKVFVLGFTAVGWLLAVAFAVIFLALCSGKAMGATKGDVAIMRSMGIPTRVIKVSIYIQTFISLIPAYLITAATCILIYTTPKTNGMFPFIHTEGYILIAVSLFLVALGLSRRYAKKMFSESVKKTLRGGKRDE